MKIYLSILLIITYINSCSLEKKQHNLDKCLVKRKFCSDDYIETDDISQNDHQKKVKLSTDNFSDSLEIECPKECLINLDSDFKLKNDSYLRKEITENKNLDNFGTNDDDNSCTSEHVEKSKNVLPKHMKTLKKNITQYMIKVLTVTQQDHYLPKLGNLISSYKFIVANEEKYRNYNSIFEIFDHLFLEKLDYIISEFNQDVKFTKDDYELFKHNLDSSLRSDEKLMKLVCQLKSKNFDDKKFLFYGELKNLAKYFAKIPELMVLGGFCSDKSIDVIILSMHLINLLLEKRKTEVNNKVFILFLIKKAFTSSIRNRVDFFSIKMFLTECLNNQYSLHFFLWEMSNSGRNEFKLKLIYNNVLHWTKACKIHFRTIILIYLFQQMIFLKLNNVENENFKKYINFIYRVINGNRCPDCDFNEFIKMLEIF